jgi:hypothetical protein
MVVIAGVCLKYRSLLASADISFIVLFPLGGIYVGTFYLLQLLYDCEYSSHTRPSGSHGARVYSLDWVYAVNQVLHQDAAGAGHSSQTDPTD